MIEADTTQVDALVQDVLGGDLDAYARLVRLFQSDLWGSLSGLLFDRDLTKDIVQDAFIKAYFHLEDYSQGTSFRAWLRGIARNTALNEIRSRSRRRKHLDSFREDYLTRMDEDAEGDIQAAHLHALKECQEALPERSRDVLLMRYTERVSIEEIAQRLKSTGEAIRQMLWRIRSALRDCVEQKTVQA